jgi:hypothetical protein
MGFDCTHNTVWIENTVSDTVNVLAQCPGSLTVNRLPTALANITDGSGAQDMTYDNATHVMYISDSATDTVSAIETDTLQPPTSAQGIGCPTGVADYGINGNQTYSYTTSSFESQVVINKLSIGTSSQAAYNNLASLQLNVMAYGMPSHISNGIYWTQDVFSLNQSSTCPNLCFQLTSEIFNMTVPGGTILYKNGISYTCSNNGVKGHVTKAANTYYCDTKWQTGLELPLTVKLEVTTGTETSGKFKGEGYLSFNYLLSSGPASDTWIQFDRIHFNNTLPSGKKVSGNPVFEVSGSPATTPPYSSTQRCSATVCPLANDAEIDFEGYAGLAQVQFLQLAATMNLYYLSAGTYTLVPHAFSAGADTGETAANVYVARNGTVSTGNASVGSDDAVQLW